MDRENNSEKETTHSLKFQAYMHVLKNIQVFLYKVNFALDEFKGN